MKAVLINTTFHIGHHGCTLVDRQLGELASEAGMAIVAKLPIHSDWERLAPADFDVVIVNGEGSLHHDTKAARRLAEVPKWAHARGRPCYLVNSVYESNGPEVAAGVAGYNAIYARDELSRRALKEAGIAASAVPDITLSWQPRASGGKGRRVVVTDSTVEAANRQLHGMAQAIGARYLPLMAQPPWDEPQRRWRYALKRLAAHAAPPGLWRDRWRGLIPDFDAFVDWLTTNAGLIVSGRFHGVCIALDLGIPVLGVRSNTWKVEALLAGAGLEHRLVSDLSEIERRLGSQGIEPFRYTEAELEKIQAMRQAARAGGRAMFDAIVRDVAARPASRKH